MLETPTADVPASGFVDDKFLAAHTPFSRSWYQHARLIAEGPPHYKAGKKTVYRWTEVLTWLEAHVVASKVG
jgi:hypothetical protein